MKTKNWISRVLLTILFGSASGYIGFLIADKYIQSLGSLNMTDRLPPYFAICIVFVYFGLLAERLVYNKFQKMRSSMKIMTTQDKAILGVGLVLGLFIAASLNNSLNNMLKWYGVILSTGVLGYIISSAIQNLIEQWRLYSPGGNPSAIAFKTLGRPKLMDTNVIIDGRIADICRAGFVEGPILVPKFILEELQQIADSSDSLKRARGRRGLEILNQMQKEIKLDITECSMEGPKMEVDSRLVKVAKELKAAIITNDYNLNKVAGLQGVEVLNINELANALKPVVLPGEEMRVLLIKEGKEKDQGIGYLDDGTMIVVEGGRKLMGETIEVSVTSVLQTVQGKMIFAKNKNEDNQENSFDERNVSSYTGSRSRTKIR